MQSQNFQYEKHLIDKFNQQELIGLTFHPDSMGLFLFKVFDHTKGISWNIQIPCFGKMINDLIHY